MVSSATNTQRSGMVLGYVHIIQINKHSNVGIERVYSLVNKSKLIGTERNWLVTKCYNFVPYTKLLSANYNLQHSN